MMPPESAPTPPAITAAERLGRAVVDVLVAHGLQQLTIEPDSWPGSPGQARALHNLWVMAQGSSVMTAIHYTHELLEAFIHDARMADGKIVWPGDARQSASLAALNDYMDALLCTNGLRDVSRVTPLEVPRHD
jgi:hypothetical protein